MNNCGTASSTATAYAFRYEYTAVAQTRGNDANWHVNCFMDLAITMKRDKWIAQVDDLTTVPVVSLPGNVPPGSAGFMGPNSAKASAPMIDLDKAPDVLRQVPVT
jgi:hypothetical protein